MDIKQFIDATYLKTASQANLSESENTQIIINYINEAIQYGFKLIMIRPSVVNLAKKRINESHSKVLIGTVIDFPLGQNNETHKLQEAQKAIDDGADELDFVINYEAFKTGNIDLVKQEVLHCTSLALNANKVIKWIIEVAALNDTQIIQICTLIKNVILSNYSENQYEQVFVKSSTGFYKTENNLPNGATIHTIKMMLENSFPLPVKAAGGVRNYKEAIEMIKLGVKRIGTSAAKTIVEGNETNAAY